MPASVAGTTPLAWPLIRALTREMDVIIKEKGGGGRRYNPLPVTNRDLVIVSQKIILNQIRKYWRVPPDLNCFGSIQFFVSKREIKKFFSPSGGGLKRIDPSCQSNNIHNKGSLVQIKRKWKGYIVTSFFH